MRGITNTMAKTQRVNCRNLLDAQIMIELPTNSNDKDIKTKFSALLITKNEQSLPASSFKLTIKDSESDDEIEIERRAEKKRKKTKTKKVNKNK